jgi:hypothetical protein
MTPPGNYSNAIWREKLAELLATLSVLIFTAMTAIGKRSPFSNGMASFGNLQMPRIGAFVG